MEHYFSFDPLKRRSITVIISSACRVKSLRIMLLLDCPSPHLEDEECTILATDIVWRVVATYLTSLSCAGVDADADADAARTPHFCPGIDRT